MRAFVWVVGLACVGWSWVSAASGQEFAAPPSGATMPSSVSANLTGDSYLGLCDLCDGCDRGGGDTDLGCRFLGFLPSDHDFDCFISPLSNPFFFEDPRALTEMRGVFLNNRTPDPLGAGDIQVWAAQFRGRLTENVSVIAPRLSYFVIHPNAGGEPEGFLSAPVGLKFTLLRNVEEQFILSGGATYFIPGYEGAISNLGDGDFHFFLTCGKQIFDRGHWLSATGFRIPLDSNWGTQLWYWSNQWDYELPGHLYPLFGVNWFHWMRNAGNDLTGGIAGLDLINLPTSGVAGHSVVSGVAGLKWKPSGHLEIGGGYEFPMTNRKDILGDRAFLDVILRY